VKRTSLVVIALLTSAPVFAQAGSAPAAPQPESRQQPESGQAADAPQQPESRPRPEARQQQVRMMEGLIVAAVRNGAESLARQLQVAEPGSLIITGSARARGFALDGYGVFFDVDVPQMKQSVAWSTMMLLREARRQQLLQLLASNAGPDQKRQARAELQRIESPMAVPVPAPQPSEAAPSPVAQGAAPAPPSASGTVVAQTLNEPAASPVFDARDPNQLYTESIKSALIDAMLNYSGPMNLSADEWLTIAARDSEGPLIPGSIDDASTIVLRVKGSDISAFQSKRISLEEARKRVEVKDF
jgi:hypothetical protein